MKTVVNITFFFFLCTKTINLFFTEKGKQRKRKLQSAGQSIEPNNAVDFNKKPQSIYHRQEIIHYSSSCMEHQQAVGREMSRKKKKMEREENNNRPRGTIHPSLAINSCMDTLQWLSTRQGADMAPILFGHC